MNQDNQQDFDTVCPHCQIGRIQAVKRPYLELHQGHLFTIPRALCYICDVCDFTDFDAAAVELISNMIFESSLEAYAKRGDATVQHPAKPEDDIPAKPLHPPASS